MFINPLSEVATQSSRVWSASFSLDQDVRSLFPYINALLDDALYYEEPEHVRFLFDGYRCFLYPNSVVAGLFDSKTAAEEFASRMISFLNDIHDQKDTIKPNYDQIKQIPIIDILRILPKTNCKECGFPTCMAFAAALVKGRAPAQACPGLASPISESAEYPVLDSEGNIVDTVSLKISTSKLKYQIHEQREQILMLDASLRTTPRDEKPEESPKRSDANNFGLTDREIEVLKLIAEGYTNNEISGMLFISPHTVKSHMINIFNKLSVNDRTQAAVLATRHNII
jgi:DNA-binding CsgD family transcriptional regulator/ArsR family metal-binding transcriptional regulator